MVNTQALTVPRAAKGTARPAGEAKALKPGE